MNADTQRALIEAVKHAAISNHHPACKCRGERLGQPDRYCTCHVQKAQVALMKFNREMKRASPVSAGTDGASPFEGWFQ